MKKILFLNYYASGGAELMTIQYAKILCNKGFDVTLITHVPIGKDTKYIPEIPSDIHSIIANTRFRGYLWKIFKMIWTLRPDVVFTWQPNVVKYILNPIITYHLAPRFKLVCRCPNTPSITTQRERKEFDSFKKADFIIAQTKEMENELHTIIGVPQNRLTTIYNPIAKDIIQKNITESFYFDISYVNFVAAGRITKQKDYPTMLRAFLKMYDEYPNVRLYILGDIEDESVKVDLDTIIHKGGIENNVFFEGFQKNPHKYEIKARVFVLSSIYEGLPNAMLEAMYLGVPVAATTCIPFISQIIKEGVNGYTAPIQDYNALSKAMIAAARLKNLPKFIDATNSEQQIRDLFTRL